MKRKQQRREKAIAALDTKTAIGENQSLRDTIVDKDRIIDGLESKIEAYEAELYYLNYYLKESQESLEIERGRSASSSRYF